MDSIANFFVKINSYDKNVQAILTALASLSTMFFIASPIFTNRFPFLYNKFFLLVTLIVLMFITNAILDTSIKFEDKQCEILDSLEISGVTLISFLLFSLLSILPFTKYGMKSLEYKNPYLYSFILAVITSILVFIWKRFGKNLTGRPECTN